MNDQKMDGFEQRELLGDTYWDDPRWKIVSKLREEEKHSEANGLVLKIRSDWGIE